MSVNGRRQGCPATSRGGSGLRGRRAEDPFAGGGLRMMLVVAVFIGGCSWRTPSMTVGGGLWQASVSGVAVSVYGRQQRCQPVADGGLC